MFFSCSSSSLTFLGECSFLGERDTFLLGGDFLRRTFLIYGKTAYACSLQVCLLLVVTSSTSIYGSRPITVPCVVLARL